MSENRLWVRQIVSIEDPVYSVLLNIYEDSFPPEERADPKEFEEKIEELAGGESGFLSSSSVLALLEEQTAVGMAYCHYFHEGMEAQPIQLGYLQFMAIEQTRRGGGRGRFFYQATLAFLQAQARLRGGELSGLILEVERPELAQNEAEIQERTRRIAFYQRFGARILQNLDYHQPAVSESMPTVPLHLMYQPLKHDFEDRALCLEFCVTALGLAQDHPLTRRALSL